MPFGSDFGDGARAISPLLPPGATVGLVTGVAATTVGLTPVETAAMSVVVYSPTVMLTAFSLLESGTPVVVLVAASLIVGVRFAMLSLSIAPYFRRLATRWKWVLAYFLWTPTYALSVARFEADPGADRRAYYLGCAIPLWLVFHAALLAGIAFGARVPAGWQLDFVVPLAFIALLLRMVDDTSTALAGVAAGVIAIAATPLPYNLGIVVAAVGGTVAGVAAADGEVS